MTNDIICTNINVTFEVSMTMKGCVYQDGTYFQVAAFKTAVDLCKMSKNKNFDFTVQFKTCTQQFVQYLNHKLKCKFQKKNVCFCGDLPRAAAGWWEAAPSQDVPGRHVCPGLPRHDVVTLVFGRRSAPLSAPSLSVSIRVSTEGVRVAGTESTERSAEFSSKGAFTSDRLRIGKRKFFLVLTAMLPWHSHSTTVNKP